MNVLASISNRATRQRAPLSGESDRPFLDSDDQPLLSARKAVDFVLASARRMARDGMVLTEADLEAWAAELLQGMHEDLARKRASVEEAQAVHRRLVDLIERSDLSPKASTEKTR